MTITDHTTTTEKATKTGTNYKVESLNTFGWVKITLPLGMYGVASFILTERQTKSKTYLATKGNGADFFQSKLRETTFPKKCIYDNKIKSTFTSIDLAVDYINDNLYRLT